MRSPIHRTKPSLARAQQRATALLSIRIEIIDNPTNKSSPFRGLGGLARAQQRATALICQIAISIKIVKLPDIKIAVLSNSSVLAVDLIMALGITCRLFAIVHSVQHNFTHQFCQIFIVSNKVAELLYGQSRCIFSNQRNL